MENFEKILEHHPNPNVVTKLDFSYCYWIPGQKLCDFIKQCKNLKELLVAHSTVSNRDLAEILVEHENISKLSLSIDSPASFMLENEIENSSATCSVDPWANKNFNAIFGKCEKILSKLESLEIYSGPYPVILGTMLR